MDGLLLVDKPSGLTSHDVVHRVRRASGERRIGHTGTLDPLATGLLPLVVGRATRLATFLTGGDKTYEATVRLGVATTTDDAEGPPLGPPAASLPDDALVRAVLGRFRGDLQQVPPRHSAKKVGGRRAYELARQDRPVELAPVAVTVREIEYLARSGDRLDLRVTATAGFYVRALARDLGEALGCGAHLAALRRTRSGCFGLDRALTLDRAVALGPEVAGRLLSPAEALPELAGVRVNAQGLRRVLHGNALSPSDFDTVAESAGSGPIKVLAPDGRLVALARPRAGALHPVVVLG